MQLRLMSLVVELGNSFGVMDYEVLGTPPKPYMCVGADDGKLGKQSTVMDLVEVDIEDILGNTAEDCEALLEPSPESKAIIMRLWEAIFPGCVIEDRGVMANTGMKDDEGQLVCRERAWWKLIYTLYEFQKIGVLWII